MIIIISSLLGTLLFSSGLRFGLEACLLLLLTAESDFLLKTCQLSVNFLDEFRSEMQILRIGQKRLHVPHLSYYSVQFKGPVRGGEGRLLLLLLLFYFFLLGRGLFAFFLGVKDLHLGVFTLGVV